MVFLIIGWVVLATVLSLALFRAAARPLPRCDEETISGQESEPATLPPPKPHKARPTVKAHAEALASSYTTL